MEIVRKHIDRVWHHQDYVAIDETIRPDYVQHSRSVGQSGREPVNAFIKMVC
jgi:hypothetical protein